MAKIAARNRFSGILESKKKTPKLGPWATVQAKFGWDLREFETFVLPLSPVLVLDNVRNT